MFYLKLCCLLAIWIQHLISDVTAHADHPLLLLVSFDGFRWDYLHKVKCQGKQVPNFDKLISSGVFVKDGVKNAYVTKTFPNHYSIVTGLYEESHGVVGNTMYDPETNRNFSIYQPGDCEDPFWFDNGAPEYQGFPEPIWLSNEKPKGRFKRRSGVMFWPGSEAKGMTAWKFMHYNKSLPFKTRIDNIVSWFSDEETPINLGLLYFNEPDHTGHDVGPDSEEIIKLIIELDGYVGYLLQQLQEKNLLERMNIIITSDHGMAQINDNVYLDPYVDRSLYTMISAGPVMDILPAPGKEDELYDKLKEIPNLKVYSKAKGEIPERYHYTNNGRIMPIVVEADQGYNVCKNETYCYEKGTHGYDNNWSEMHPIFIANGPAFKKNYTSPQLNNVDIYGLMCHILRVKPAPNNGSFENIKNILYVEEGLTLSSVTLLGSVIFCACVAGIFCISTARLYIRKRPSRNRSIPLPMMTDIKKGQNLPLLTSSEDEEFA